MKYQQVGGGDGGMFNKPLTRRRSPFSLHGREGPPQQSV